MAHMEKTDRPMNKLKKDETTTGPSPVSVTRTISSPARKYRAKPLSKQDVISNESLHFWRKKYEDMIHYVRESGVSVEDADDDEVIRLLAEWNGNVKDAVLNGEKGRAWRKENLPIPRAEVLPTLKTGKFVFAGYDKVGRAICYYRVKFHNPRQFAPLQSVKAVVYLYEEMRAEGRLRGAEEICVVVDRTDAKSANMDIEFMKLLYTMLKESYPARGELFLVLGVNFIFRKIWENLVSVFLDAKSRSATHLLKDKKELLDFIEEGELVEWLGGKLPYTFVPPLDE